MIRTLALAVSLFAAPPAFAPPAFAQAPLAAPLAAAPLAAQGCLGCHGPGGAGATPVAGLAGRPAADLASVLAEYRAGTRPGTIMTRIARGYTEAEIQALAAHFAALPAGGPR